VFSVRAWVGQNGFANGKTRRQGSLTTPTGTYTMTEAFGINPNPGTALPYHQVVAGDWWVQDNNSPYYNSLRNESQGGFRPTPHGLNGSERLMDYGKQYAHAVVINFNRAPDVQIARRGSGIFLHANSGKGATAGCVSIGKPKLRLLMTYLQPRDRITIVR
jgi:L,D-peptidoglycan transpeptidase YkuD (ErfK/YbiS/YcfS/YnhG family)